MSTRVLLYAIAIAALMLLRIGDTVKSPPPVLAGQWDGEVPVHSAQFNAVYQVYYRPR